MKKNRICHRVSYCLGQIEYCSPIRRILTCDSKSLKIFIIWQCTGALVNGKNFDKQEEPK